MRDRRSIAGRSASTITHERDKEEGGLWSPLSGRMFATRAAASCSKPGFTVVAMLTLALGIGATAAIFSVVHGVLLKPLPFHDAERLVGVYHRGEAVNLAVMNQGPATYFTYRDNQRVFEDIGAWESNEVSITGRGEPERVEVLSVTHTTLPLLRVQPALGRLFNKADDVPGSPLRVVLTHGYWQRKFGRAPDVVGRRDRNRWSGRRDHRGPARLVQVPARRSGPAAADAARTRDFVMFDFQALARLKPGVTLSQANADVARMIPFLRDGPRAAQLRPNVRPLSEDVTGDIGRVLWVLLGAVGVVLLIACANVANLFLVRAEGRQQELAMRAALGASPGRIAGELLSETVLLGLAAGVLGLAFTQAAIGLLRWMAPARLPRVDEIAVDPTVLLFTLAISLLSGVLFGLVPMVRFGAVDATALKEGGRSTSDAPARLRTRNALVVAEVALALVLLIVSGLMIRTFVAMRQVHPGFTHPEEVQTFQLAIPVDITATGNSSRARTSRSPGA